MSEIEWSEETSRAYARYMEKNVRFDHRVFARRILRDWHRCPPGARVVEVAAGPAFLLLEVGQHLTEPQLIMTDSSPIMIELAQRRAAARSVPLQGRLCPAERLDLADDSVDLLLCKHFLRLAADLDTALREMARVLRPGGRAYFIDFNAERPWLPARLLQLWVMATAPSFIRWSFAETMALGLPASGLPGLLRRAGFQDPVVLHSSVSYLVRATVS